MQMTNVIISFRRHLKRRNYSKHTVKYYLNIIKQYVIWLDLPLEQVSPETIDLYIDHLFGKRMHPASIMARIPAGHPIPHGPIVASCIWGAIAQARHSTVAKNMRCGLAIGP